MRLGFVGRKIRIGRLRLKKMRKNLQSIQGRLLALLMILRLGLIRWRMLWVFIVLKRNISFDPFHLFFIIN